MQTKPSPLALRWFVVYTHARSERKVHTCLVERGITSFLPLRTIRRRTRQGIQDLEVPLFSNYVFVRTTLNRIASLSRVPGLRGFISFGERFAQVSDEEIRAIRRTCIRYQGTVGDRVVIVRGQAAGTSGTVIGTPAHQQLIVQPSAGPSTLPIRVDTDQVRAA